jgi:hypothetical protein
MDNNKDNIKNINIMIEKQICIKTIEELQDNNLLNHYLKCDSVKKSIDNLVKILREVNIKDDTIELIKNKYIIQLIPAGTKGIIRGNKFNKIVKQHINELKLNKDIYEIEFEKKCTEIDTSEIPDWYIKNKINGKIIIGMNQLDLWSGGQQTNRGSKYIFDNKINTDKTKLLCVVCNNIRLKSINCKVYKLFNYGFKNDTLCYINNIKNIIEKFMY